MGRCEAFPPGMLGWAAVRARTGCRHVGAALPAVCSALRVAAAAALPALAVRALLAAARAVGGTAGRRPPRPVPGVRRRAGAAGRRRGAAPPRLPGREPSRGRGRVRPLRRRSGGRAVPDLRRPPLSLLLPGAQVRGGPGRDTRTLRLGGGGQGHTQGEPEQELACLPVFSHRSPPLPGGCPQDALYCSPLQVGISTLLAQNRRIPGVGKDP